MMSFTFKCSTAYSMTASTFMSLPCIHTPQLCECWWAASLVATVRCQLALTHLLTTCKEQTLGGAPVRSRHTATEARESDQERSQETGVTQPERESEREGSSLPSWRHFYVQTARRLPSLAGMQLALGCQHSQSRGSLAPGACPHA